MKPRPFGETLLACSLVSIFSCAIFSLVVTYIWPVLSPVAPFVGGSVWLVIALPFAISLRGVRHRLPLGDRKIVQERMTVLLLEMSYCSTPQTEHVILFTLVRGFSLWKWPIYLTLDDDGRNWITGPAATVNLLLKRYGSQAT